MKEKRYNLPLIILVISLLVLVLSIIALIVSYELSAIIDVIGIRIAALIIAFGSFGSSSFFSFLIYTHNRTVSKINDDTNKRAELFRELQFASTNYSIIEFMDRMLLYIESSRYVERFFERKTYEFHMLEVKVKLEDLIKTPDDYQFTSIRIPFKVIEGKVVSKVELEKLIFDRINERFEFYPAGATKLANAFLLYNERTKRNNIIINVVTKKTDNFFLSTQVNQFSKIKITLSITSLLGVNVKGVNELYFTNPEQIEGDGTNTYKINSSNFTITEMPRVELKNLLDQS